MGTVLDLHAAEQLDLWLQSLQIYHRDSGVYLSTREALPEDFNYREDLRGSWMVLQDITGLMPPVVKASIQELPGDFSGLAGISDAKLRRLIRTHPMLQKEFVQLLDCWEFLIRYQVIGASILRNTVLGKSEFKAYTSILAREIGRYCQSECHQSLLNRYHRTKIHHTILRDILLEIDVDGIREELQRVFGQFFSLLGVAAFFQSSMATSFQIHKFNILLGYCHHGCEKLLARLDQAYDYIEYCQPDLAQGLSPVKFGLRVEFRRIFKRELRQLETENRMEEKFSQIENAIGLLKQTAEEAFTSLVHHFNPDFVAEDLFLDMRQRTQDSAQLQADLKALYRKIVEIVENPRGADCNELTVMLANFRKGSMRALFYKDWQPFEKFSQELATSEEDEIPFLVHRFEVYVSTLLGEVSKRSVLTKAIHHPNTAASS